MITKLQYIIGNKIEKLNIIEYKILEDLWNSQYNDEIKHIYEDLITKITLDKVNQLRKELED